MTTDVGQRPVWVKCVRCISAAAVMLGGLTRGFLKMSKF